MTQWTRTTHRPFVLLIALGLALMVGLPAHAQAPTADWTHRFGGDANENVQDIAIDADGRAYVVGMTDGEFAQPAEGFFDGFVHAVAPDGTVDWTRQIHTGDFEVYTSIVVAPDGDVLIAGVSDGPVDGPSAGGDDAFLMRLSPDGEERWRAAFGTPERDDALALAVDADGTIYVGGTSEGGLGGEPVGGEDGFLIALAPDGQERWRHAVATDANEELFAATALPDGGVVVAVSSQGSLDAPNEGGYDVYLRAYDADGAITRRASLHDAADLRAFGLAVAPDGDWLVVGSGPEGPDDGGDVPVFAAAIASDGSTRWMTGLGHARRDMWQDVALAADGTIVVIATTEADVVSENAGVADALIYGLDGDGTVLWSQQLGSARFDDASAVAAGSGGGLWVTGNAQGALPGGEPDDGFDDDGWVWRYTF